MADDEVERGSGNVFADLGFPRPEEYKAKVLLALRIKDRIADQNLTQQDAAHRMALSQAGVSKISRGIVSGFTFDRLFRCLNALDQSVRIVLESAPEEPGRGRLSVEGAVAGA
ncbi:MAG: XRE family transcriptional regulator [Armatimonadetes bacterium]|nr:XRE family transcriptional regulator [Armatimonadota bacterium]